MSENEYDLCVIGGGSGGMSCAKAAASLGARVVLFDFVKPSPQGSAWTGLGGTCVNVGCVPKKLFHFTAQMGHCLHHDGTALGWSSTAAGGGGGKAAAAATHNWDTLTDAVTQHIKQLNFRYRVALKHKNVTYVNALASFIDAHTIGYTLTGKNGGPKQLTSANVLIAVGGRPLIPADIPGAVEHGITSDDIFTLDHRPGKTLCVGGSYISLECAGFLTGLGYDTTVACRSILLRGFDRQCAEKVGSLMVEEGTKILMGAKPTSITKTPAGKLQVVFEEGSEGAERMEQFDTVLFATGRTPDLAGLNLAAVGVEVDASSGKISVVDERTNVANIFAVGDVCLGKQELTPVAIKAGELLAKRLFGGAAQTMDYGMVPTTVFTPFEYGTVGQSEEEAIAQYGIEDVEVYLSEFTTLELSAVHRNKHPMHGEDEAFAGPTCLSKLVCVKSLDERVVGFHFVGPNAGEITQGFALAVKMGATKAQFDSVVGIHPTDAESFCALSTTKRSGVSWVAEGGCGGGVCG